MIYLILFIPIVNYNYAQRSGAWRDCELRNRIIFYKDKISCEM